MLCGSPAAATAVLARTEQTRLQFLRLLESPSSFLALALPTLGSTNNAHSETQQDNWHREQDQQDTLLDAIGGAGVITPFHR